MRIAFVKYLFALLVGYALILPACSRDERSRAETTAEHATSRNVSYTETGDLPAIKARGTLRILSPRENAAEGYLLRDGSPLDLERKLATKFALKAGLEPVFVEVAHCEELIPALLAGQGDLIAANLTVTEARKTQMAFTVPVGNTREFIVSRATDTRLKKPADLAGRTVAIQQGTSFWDTVGTLRKRHPKIKLKTLPGNLSSEEILDMVAFEEIDVTVENSNVLAHALRDRDDVAPALQISNDRPLAWGVRPDNAQLLNALDRFLTQEQLTRQQAVTYRDDLDGIKPRKVIRLLTRNTAATYFLWRAELLGFEYELAKEFARQNELRLEVVVAPSYQQLIPMLLEGKGDFIAAFMTPTEQRRAHGLAFSRPYHYASEVVVARRDEPPVNSVEDLKGRRIVVRRSSSYWETLTRLKAQGIDFALLEAPETMDTEDIIAKVAAGEYDLSVADSNILDLELTWRDDIQGVLALTEPQPHGWAVRAKDTKLLAAINTFFKKEYRGLFYNVTYNKYFKDTRLIVQQREEFGTRKLNGHLSPYDELVKKYARQYGFDWRLLVAQMYEESRFDPKATSWAGAKGLLQVMPRTAQAFAAEDLEDPEIGLHAGVKYLDWVRDRFSAELPVVDRMWFTLGAYNAGAGHVHDARRLARQEGLNPNRWFGHVENAMLLLSKREYATQARHGYVRGSEPVRYVRNIRDRFSAYVLLTEGAQVEWYDGAVQTRKAATQPARRFGLSVVGS